MFNRNLFIKIIIMLFMICIIVVIGKYHNNAKTEVLSKAASIEASPVYGINVSDGKLYKSCETENGVVVEKLLDEKVSEAKTSGDWIYYVTSSKPLTNEIWKIKKDGTGKSFIAGSFPIEKINIEGDWIYFINYKDHDNKLYRVKNDGNELSLLSDDKVESYQIYNKSICYSEPYFMNFNCGVYKMDLDGANKVKLAEGYTIIEKYMADGWIYFLKYGPLYNEGDIFKIKYDGSKMIKVLDSSKEDTSHIMMDYLLGDWIYYETITDTKKIIHKVKIDGSKSIRVDEKNFVLGGGITSNGWYYYSNPYDKNCLYRVKIDGTEKSQLTNEAIKWIVIYNNRIYYNDIEDKNGSIYSINMDGSDKIYKKFDYVLKPID